MIKAAEPVWDIDCRATPYDLRPAVSAIMMASNWLLEQLPEDQTLIILMGERHRSQTHTLLQKYLLKSLCNQAVKTPEKTFAFGFEGDHNYAFKKQSLKDTFLSFIGYERPTDQRAISAFIRDVAHAKEKADFFKFCAHEKISVRFNDIANINRSILSPIDQTDAFSLNLIRKNRPDLVGKNILRGNTSDGIALSNLAIVEKAIEHVRETTCRIYIQQCGLSHLFGRKKHIDDFLDMGLFKHIREEYAYADSLSARFKERGFTILPVSPNFESHEHIPDESEVDLRQTIKIVGLEEGDRNVVAFDKLQKKISKASCYEF